MARQHEIRYINSFVSGNVAYQMESKTLPASDTIKLPKLPKQSTPIQQKEMQISVEPMAVLAITMAVVLLIMLSAGCIQLYRANAEAVRMEQYLQTLRNENIQLKDTYASGYDLAEIEEMALAMGMIPMDQAEHITISVAKPVTQPMTEELSAWDHFVTFLTGLFA